MIKGEEGGGGRHNGRTESDHSLKERYHNRKSVHYRYAPSCR